MLSIKQGIIASLFELFTQITKKFVGIFSLMVLARVLTPEDFGVVAVALIFLNFSNAITDSGSRHYLMSLKDMDSDHVSTAWTLSFILKNLVATVLIISSSFISDYYNDPRIGEIILVFASIIFISTLTSPDIEYKYKNQDLKEITFLTFFSRLLTVGITVAVAVIYETYWALVMGQLTSAVTFFFISYKIAPCIPKFSLKNLSEQWNFSKWVIPRSLINFVRDQFDSIYVSTSFDKSVMGAYNSMRYYGFIPFDTFIRPAFGTLLAQASQFKDIPDYFKRQLTTVIFILLLVSIPIVFLVFSHYEFLVHLILGEKWTQYAQLLAFFTLSSCLLGLFNLSCDIVILHSKTSIIFIYTLVSTIVQLYVLISVDFEDIFELALYKVGLDILSICLFFIFITIKYLSFAVLLSFFYRLFLISGFMLLAGWLSNLIQPDGKILYFLIHSTMSMIIYVTCILAYLYLFSSKDKSAEYIFQLLQKTFIKITKRNKAPLSPDN
ncbi:oligosaccharide flippase family protein [Glaciecola sp. 1036]|uniref:oligosaccharide flippase family protein n=1 Tax=Alteromonadaceae TaxID=72275 RepID=UPI003D01EDCC